MRTEMLTRWHLENMVPQDRQAPSFQETDFDSFYLVGRGFAVMDREEVVAIFTLYPVDQNGRYLAFTVLCNNVGTKRLLWIAKKARNWLDTANYRRIEAYCMEDAVDELHWCRYILKMELEGKLRSFMSDGRAAYLFSRIRNGD